MKKSSIWYSLHHPLSCDVLFCFSVRSSGYNLGTVSEVQPMELQCTCPTKYNDWVDDAECTCYIVTILTALWKAGWQARIYRTQFSPLSCTLAPMYVYNNVISRSITQAAKRGEFLAGFSIFFRRCAREAKLWKLTWVRQWATSQQTSFF